MICFGRSSNISRQANLLYIIFFFLSATRLSTDSTEPYNCEKLDSIEGGFKLLAKPQALFSVNFEDPSEIASLIEGKLFSLKFNLEEDGRLDCLAAWFNLDLGHGQTISTAPELGHEGCWEQAIFRPPGPGSGKRLHRGDLLEAEFLVKKHVILQQVEVSPGASVVENGVARPTVRSRQQLVLPPSSLKLLSDPTELSISQWLAYNLVTSGHATKILHFSSWMPPIAALQVPTENMHIYAYYIHKAMFNYFNTKLFTFRP